MCRKEKVESDEWLEHSAVLDPVYLMVLEEVDKLSQKVSDQCDILYDIAMCQSSMSYKPKAKQFHDDILRIAAVARKAIEDYVEVKMRPVRFDDHLEEIITIQKMASDIRHILLVRLLLDNARLRAAALKGIVAAIAKGGCLFAAIAAAWKIMKKGESAKDAADRAKAEKAEKPPEEVT